MKAWHKHTQNKRESLKKYVEEEIELWQQKGEFEKTRPGVNG